MHMAIKQGSIFILFCFTLGYAIVLDIPVENLNYEIIAFQNYARLMVANGTAGGEPGAPEIPRIVYTCTIDQDCTIKNVTILDEKWVEIPGIHNVYPQQEPCLLNQVPEFTAPDQEIYDSDGPYPDSIISGYCSGNLRGFRIGQIMITPFRYYPKAGKLKVISSLKVDIKTESCTPGIKPMRQSSLSSNIFSKFISSIALNDETSGLSADLNVEENPEDLSPTNLPSLLGPPVDLLIITTEDLTPAYESFAEFKKLFGFNTAIKTITWVRQHYCGVDDAERIRYFIKDAVIFWGTSYVLLGNDVPAIPTRWVWLNMSWPPMHFTSDLYFSDLDGTWNRDGDERFGEVSDSVDFYPDVFVGRLPAHSCDDVTSYLAKLRSYLLDPAVPPSGIPPYQRKALFVSSRFSYDHDSYIMSLSLSAHLPANFVKRFQYEKSVAEYKEAIYDDYNLITFLAHGDVNVMRVLTTPRQHVTNFSYDSLTNSVYPLMVVITCWSGPFQEDCLGEHWVMNHNGGGIGYIGPTSPSEPSTHKPYVASLFDSLFSLPLAAAQAYSKIPQIAASQSDNYSRMFQFSINLLADPAISLVSCSPRYYDSVLVQSDTINLGIDTVRLSLIPITDSFFVTFYKENDLFIKDTGFAGTAETAVKTDSSGYLKYAIQCRGFVIHIDSIYVRASDPLLLYHHNRVDDLSGNGNGMINPGEAINLYLVLKNNGSSAASGVSTFINSADTFITITNDTSSYPDIAPDGIAENLTPFSFTVSKTIPDEHPLKLELLMNYAGTTGFDTCQIIPYAPELFIYSQFDSATSDTFSILLVIENRGHCTADSVYSEISAISDTILVLDSLAGFPNIPPNEIVPALDSFKLYMNYPGRIVYNTSIYYRGVEVVNKKIDLKTPVGPDSLWVRGSPNAVILEWTPVSGSVGYRIYRAAGSNQPYQFIRNALEPICYYEDFSTQQGHNYYYYLQAVDSSMNEGLCSDTVLARTNPKPALGWPKAVYGYLFSSPNFCDIDPYPGLEIIVCSTNGDVYAWHYDGTPVSGDGRIFSCSKEIWSSPAIGDVNRDGSMEIAFGIRRATDNLYILTRYDTLWIPLPGWPKTLNGGVLSSPVLADVDEDGDLEIFAGSEGGGLYAFHHTGNGVYHPDGLLKQLYGSISGTPAIGDINTDGDLEIISCSGSLSDSLFVFDRFGNYLPPFPISVMPKICHSMVLGDISGDDGLEICFYSDSFDYVHVVDAGGNILWQNNIYSLGDVEASPILANVVGNERPEIICGNNKGYQVLSVFDSSGSMVPGFPPPYGHDYKLPIAADADGDSSMDILCGAADWELYACRNNGQLATGFPIHFGIRVEMSPAVWDIDLDGNLELMVGADDFKFWVFDLNSKLFEWPKFRYDQYNTGVYKSPFLSAGEHAVAGHMSTGTWLIIYPNPAPGRCHIVYSLLQESDARISLYDVVGRLVKEIADEHQYTGIHHQMLNMANLAQGVYFVRLETGGYKTTEKIILLR